MFRLNVCFQRIHVYKDQKFICIENAGNQFRFSVSELIFILFRIALALHVLCLENPPNEVDTWQVTTF